MENAVYWNGRQVGIECAGRISWFSSAPQEAMTAYAGPSAVTIANSTGEGDVIARNLGVTASFDRVKSGV
ncbi:MAG TPA: hypothetical protein VFE79_19120 [Paraburkholderia sp.]|nr:hypothetical protein [Paraburkholderia sp.]